MKRKVWILAGKAFGKAPLGPAVRIREMAKAAAERGHEVHVAVVAPESNPLPAGIELHDLSKLDLDGIRPGDGLVFGPYLPAPLAWRLLRTGIPFHLDLYCVTATEQLALWERSPGKARDAERLKLRKRYLLHARAAETIYVSCLEQWLVVAGMFLSEPSWARARAADSRTPDVRELPMGVREDPFPCGAENPYPKALHGRPVFLWGGSLWNWFDLATLLDAFAILQERGSDAALFFLSGTNRTERSSEDDPVRWMRAQAQARGLLDRTIFFNQTSVSPGQLAPWLEHCRAGILSNPPSLEALSSWRTRYLDLLWARKPLVVSGVDPLGGRMSEAGGALRVPAGSARDLADAVQRLADDRGLASGMGDHLSELAARLSWSRNLSPFLDALEDPGAFTRRGFRPGWKDAVGYLAS